MILATSLLLASIALGGSNQTAAAPCANPGAGSAADELAASFDAHQFVFIGSTHGDAKIEEFLRCLVSRPAFKQRVTDIVVEWASSGQQRLLDRYLIALEEIPNDELAPIWFDTDYPLLWATLPQIRQFLQALREVNQGLPAAKRIRLVAGNDGVDWARVHAVEDLAPYPYKTNLMPHLIIEHLAKTPGNKTLIVYGDAHIRYKGNNFMGELEYALGRSKLFVVGRIGDLREDERKYLTAVGDLNKTFFVTAQRFPTDIPWPGSLRIGLDELSERLADYIDAFVYLGPQPDKNLMGSIALTDAQKRELDRRSAITSEPQRMIRARLQGRDKWFSKHPDDFPARP